jgi:hypothetical protein
MYIIIRRIKKKFELPLIKCLPLHIMIFIFGAPRGALGAAMLPEPLRAQRDLLQGVSGA